MPCSEGLVGLFKTYDGKRNRNADAFRRSGRGGFEPIPCSGPLNQEAVIRLRVSHTTTGKSLRVKDIMSGEFQFFDIIILAMIAGFLILRLRRVLGRRDGHEGG